MSPGAEVLSGINWHNTDVPEAEHGQITRVGALLRRFRLDELPQLLNVVKGDVYLVGPRPERPRSAKERAKLIPGYEKRLQVKPGITGWAQIHYPYRNATEKLKYDLYYIQHRSLWLDLVILLRTFLPVLRGHGH
jgi:lipopolysaccharide/colanic/teichoic acid biosynthesis glycosyltransferase